MNEAPIGLIAGQGRLPVHIADGIRAAGRRVACVGLLGQYADDLPRHCDLFATSAVLRPGRWIRLLRRWRASEAVLIGRVSKSQMMYDPLRLLRQIPDWRLAKLWYRTLRHDKRPTRVLTGVADMLAGEGIELIDSTRYIPCSPDARRRAISGMTSTSPGRSSSNSTNWTSASPSPSRSAK